MATDDFFRARLDQMIDLRHPLAVLAQKLPWAQLEAALSPTFARRDRPGHPMTGADLFGPSLAVAGAGVSPAGRPRLPLRLMIALLYLKHAFDLRTGGALVGERRVAILQRSGVLHAEASL